MSLGYSVQEIVDTLEDAEIQNCDYPKEMIITQVVALHEEAEQSISLSTLHNSLLLLWHQKPPFRSSIKNL